MQRLLALQPRSVAVRESRIHARTIIQPFGGCDLGSNPSGAIKIT